MRARVEFQLRLERVCYEVIIRQCIRATKILKKGRLKSMHESWEKGARIHFCVGGGVMADMARFREDGYRQDIAAEAEFMAR